MALDTDLTALRALGGFFALRTGEPPNGPLPTLAQAYTARHTGGDEERFGARADPLGFRVRKVADSVRTPEARVAASLTHQGLVARLWAVALGSAALYDHVPDLDPALLRWDPDGAAPDELWLTEVRARPADAIGEVVREGHLAPLAAALRERFRMSERLLRGNAGSALMGALRQLERWSAAGGRPDVRDRARGLAADLLAHPGLSDTLDPATLRRRSCCLYYRVPGGGLCGDCCFDRPPSRH
ncbi:(2Fe-2S)-binding protein [Streptomyces acidicola]|uniref:(2Fe-2S)-binding protein n=1 Tax=Streptomyces acidicola TaxID=2596892 RepID=UPI002AD587CA|nr:(2Fe-2S)-binding protein [Streptomyces acidicola]